NQSLGQHARWTKVFACLHNLRRWGPRDRVTEEDAAAISEDAHHTPQASVRLEIEMAFDPSDDIASAHRQQVTLSVERVGGRVVVTARMVEIAYDALLVDVTADAAEAISQRSDDSLASLVDVFSIRPQSVLNVRAAVETEPSELVRDEAALGPPIVAI